MRSTLSYNINRPAPIIWAETEPVKDKGSFDFLLPSLTSIYDFPESLHDEMKNL